MADSSPKVPSEPSSFSMSDFRKNESIFSRAHRSYSDPKSRRILNPLPLPTNLDQSSEIDNSSCKCPHVLISDDDHFQEFYYQNLFQRSLCFDGLNIDKKDFRLKHFSSGEDLVAFFSEIASCGCSTLTMIITDYNMGIGKMNGVETVMSLREKGFKNPIILRTSETKEVLGELHSNFESMLETKEIECLLNKKDHLETKSTIYEMLRNIHD